MQTLEVSSFIDSLELPPADLVHVGRKTTIPLTAIAAADAATTDGVVTADPNKPSGFVDDGSLVSFAAGIDAQSQADVLNSALLAQLAANKKYDRETNITSWYDFYRNVLENVGWVVQGFQFEKHEVGGGSVTVDQIVASILGAIVAPNELEVIKATIEAVKNLQNNDNRRALFESASHSDQNGNFQISHCAEVDGVVMMTVAALYFSASESLKRVLWFDFSSSNSTFYKCTQSITLNKDTYGQVRETIIEKLGENAKNFVADLDI